MGNVETDNTNWLDSSGKCVSITHSQVSPDALDDEDIFNEIIEEDESFDSCFVSQNNDDLPNDLYDSNLDDIGILQDDALEYIAGYIIRKLNLVEYECNQDSNTWVDQVSKGFLKKPKTEFVIKFRKLEAIFYKKMPLTFHMSATFTNTWSRKVRVSI